MFSLIITIVAVALAVALVGVTMYHGGDIMDKGRAEATVAQSLSELAQVRAALTSYYANTGEHAPNLDALKPDYLASLPEGWGVEELPSITAIQFESSRVRTGTPAERLSVCTQINAHLGRTGEPPLCSDIDSTFSGCCQMPSQEP